MASKVSDTISATTTGAKNPGTLTTFPALGGSVHMKLSTGTATVRVRMWNIAGAPETVATFTFPVPATNADGMPNANVGAMSDMCQIYGQALDFDYYVDAIAGGGTLDIDFRGTEV